MIAYPWPAPGEKWRDKNGFNKNKLKDGLGRKERVSLRYRDSESNVLYAAEMAIWSSMFSRCYNRETAAYFDYGKRGIRVCPRWRSFYNFMDDMGPRPSPIHSIDRIDNDKGYRPDNCRWATREEQAQNRRPKCKARAKRRNSYVRRIKA